MPLTSLDLQSRGGDLGDRVRESAISAGETAVFEARITNLVGYVMLRATSQSGDLRGPQSPPHPYKLLRR